MCVICCIGGYLRLLLLTQVDTADNCCTVLLACSTEVSHRTSNNHMWQEIPSYLGECAVCNSALRELYCSVFIQQPDGSLGGT